MFRSPKPTISVMTSLFLVAALFLPTHAQSLLTDYRVEVDERIEASYDLPEGYVITGLGLGQRFPNEFTTLRIKMQPLLEGGQLGEAIVVRAGSWPEYELFANLDLPAGWVAVGFSASRYRLAVLAAPVKPDGSLGLVKEFRTGMDPEDDMDISFKADENRVLTGVGLRYTDVAMAAMRARTARMPGTSAPQPVITQPEGLHVGNLRVEIEEQIESRFFAPEGLFGDHQGLAVTGMGARASGHEICGVLLRYNSVRRNGVFGDPVIIRSGRNAASNMEAEIMLPDGWVAVGVAVSGMPEGDIKTMIVYGSPILPDGTLGIVREFRGGFLPDLNEFERSVMLEGNRVITGYGLRMGGHAINGIRLESMEITGTPLPQ